MSKLTFPLDCNPTRTVCAVLQDMRTAHKTRNYSYLPGLIEELQSYGNRMEDAIWSSKCNDEYIIDTIVDDDMKIEDKLKKIEELVRKRRPKYKPEKDKDDDSYVDREEIS